MTDDSAVPVERSKVYAIEGGRSIKARDVLADFATRTDSLAIEYPLMAGFCIVVWNDEGDAEIAIRRGMRCPYAPTMLVDLIKSKVTKAFGT